MINCISCSGWNILVLANDDKARVVESRFHRDPPQGGRRGRCSLAIVSRLLQHLSGVNDLY